MVERRDDGSGILEIEDVGVNTDDPSVSEIGENRFVVTGEGTEFIPEDSQFGLAAQSVLSTSESTYGFEVAAKTPDGIEYERIGGDSAPVVFEKFIQWYASQVAPTSSPEDVLLTLISESELAVEG